MIDDGGLVSAGGPEQRVAIEGLGHSAASLGARQLLCVGSDPQVGARADMARNTTGHLAVGCG